MKVKKRTQVRFTRTKVSPNQYKTRVKLERTANYTPHRGVVHKIVGVKDRFVGDVPSLKNKLHSVKPKTFKGKTALFIVKSNEALIRRSAQFGIKNALHAENAALKSFDYVKRPLYLQAERQYYKFKYSDETLRGILTAGGVAKDLIKLPYKPRKEYKNYLHAKDNLLHTKQTFKFTKKSNKKALKKKKKAFQKQKKTYKWHKKSYSKSSKTPIQNLLIERRIQIYKDQKKDYKKFKHEKKKANKIWRKQLYKQKKVVKKQKKLITEPFKEVLVKKPLLSIWFKISAVDETNDFMTASDKVLTVYRQVKKTPQTQLHKAQRKADKLHSKASKAQGSLKKRGSLLHSKKYKKKYNKKKFFNKHSGFKNTLNKAIHGFNIVRASTTKILLFLVPIILFLILLFVLTFQSCTAVFSNSGFVLGMYPVKDEDMAQTEAYYTQLAWDYNQKIIQLGSKNTWRYGLRAFGISDYPYKDEPDEFIFGTSSRFTDEPNYDYDPYTLMSFLSAYNYDYEASKKAEENNESFDIEYWEFNGKTRDVLKRLFDMQYQFDYYYDNTSHWEELYNYEFLGGGGSDYSYYTVYADESYHDRVKARSIPSEIWKYVDKDGFLHFNENLEILNAKDKNERTGWFIQDQRYIIIDPSGYRHNPFFYYNSNSNKFFWIFNGHENVRDYWGWSESDQAWWLVPPGDTVLWNSNLYRNCLINFYRKNEWIENCRLYYTVHQKMTLDEACKAILSSMSYSDDRLQYYDLLKNGDENMVMYGGHQSLTSPLSGNFNDMENKVYNGYGWDMQNWNQVHCSLNKLHNGIDYVCNPGSSVFSMIDGEISEIDTDEHKVVIETTSDMYLWNDEHEIRVTYYNVNTQNLKEGDTVSSGDRIGYSTGHKICDGKDNENAQKDFICITIEFGEWGWDYVDPRFLINF